MVEVDTKGEIASIVIKPSVTNLSYGWVIAVWTQVFTQFLHDHLRSQQLNEDAFERNAESLPELSVGHVLQAALRGGLRIQGVQFPQCSYLDIGTPDDLSKAVYDRKLHEAGSC
jgi:glucose-1-phosphate thymidylyltransferase